MPPQISKMPFVQMELESLDSSGDSQIVWLPRKHGSTVLDHGTVLSLKGSARRWRVSEIWNCVKYLDQLDKTWEVGGLE